MFPEDFYSTRRRRPVVGGFVYYRGTAFPETVLQRVSWYFDALCFQLVLTMNKLSFGVRNINENELYNLG